MCTVRFSVLFYRLCDHLFDEVAIECDAHIFIADAVHTSGSSSSRCVNTSGGAVKNVTLVPSSCSIRIITSSLSSSEKPSKSMPTSFWRHIRHRSIWIKPLLFRSGSPLSRSTVLQGWSRICLVDISGWVCILVCRRSGCLRRIRCSLHATLVRL